MDKNGPTDPARVVEVKRPNEVKLAEKPAEVLGMALKDSLKFGILIGNHIIDTCIKTYFL